MPDLRVCTTQDLRYLARWSTQHTSSRVPLALLNRLDEHGYHVLERTFIEREDAPVFRTRAMVKVKGSNTPEITRLDVRSMDWSQLATAEEHLAKLQAAKDHA